MYRPNRIGPSPLIILDSEARSVDPSGYVANTLLQVPRFNFIDLAVPLERQSRTARTNGPITIPALSHIAVAVRISGRVLKAPSAQYVVSYAGSFTGWSVGEAFTVRALIGRPLEQGSLDSGTGQYSWVPANSGAHQSTSGVQTAAVLCDANGTCLSGDFDDEGVPERDLDIAFGFDIMNGEDQSLELTHANWSMSVHRYEGDLDSFDPNR